MVIILLVFLQLKLNLTKGNANKNHCGPFSKFTTRSRVTSTICSTDVRQSAESFISTVWMKKQLMQTLQLSGRKQDMKTYVVCGVYRPETRILQQIVSAGCLKANQRRAGLQNVSIVGAEAVLGSIQYISYNVQLVTIIKMPHHCNHIATFLQQQIHNFHKYKFLVTNDICEPIFQSLMLESWKPLVI